MNTKQVLYQCLERLPQESVSIFSTGNISKIGFLFRKQKNMFFMSGSMGLALSIGLGVALHCSRQVFVFDGDGSFMMELSNVLLIKKYQPSNLTHILLDNESYESTGMQRSLSEGFTLSSIAEPCYKTVIKIDTKNKFNDFLDSLSVLNGPNLVHIKCSFNYEAFKPVEMPAHFISRNFRDFILTPRPKK